MKFTLESGHVIEFDKEDLRYLMCTAWKVYGNGYLSSSIKGNHSTFHRLVLGKPDSVIDHINGNKLDNRKSNLRVSNQTINNFNKKTKTHTSKYRGVSWCKTKNLWRATIMKNRKQKSIGYFGNELEAYSAYISAAKELYGFLPYEISDDRNG